MGQALGIKDEPYHILRQLLGKHILKYRMIKSKTDYDMLDRERKF